MHNEYDEQTALHYAAFRPALHLPILNKCIENEKYKIGLDIGCGTGQSSVALANICKKVIGIDPSKEMLEKAIKNENIIYQYSDGRHLPFENNYFDIITFAGSLYYAKSQQLLDEVNRVVKDKGRVVVYDFEILLDDVLLKLKVNPVKSLENKYNHQENFSGLMLEALKIEKISSGIMLINIAPENLAHLLLSSKENYDLLEKRFGFENLFQKMEQQLFQINKNENFSIKAKIFLAVYICEK